jgi:hypothetical protein
MFAFVLKLRLCFVVGKKVIFILFVTGDTSVIFIVKQNVRGVKLELIYSSKNLLYIYISTKEERKERITKVEYIYVREMLSNTLTNKKKRF